MATCRHDATRDRMIEGSLPHRIATGDPQLPADHRLLELIDETILYVIPLVEGARPDLDRELADLRATLPCSGQHRRRRRWIVPVRRRVRPVACQVDRR